MPKMVTDTPKLHLAYIMSQNGWEFVKDTENMDRGCI